MLNHDEITTFEIKQEWLDDMSSKLDAYNKQQRRRWFAFFYFPLFALVSAYGLFFYSKNVSQSSSPESEKMVLTENISNLNHDSDRENTIERERSVITGKKSIDDRKKNTDFAEEVKTQDQRTVKHNPKTNSGTQTGKTQGTSVKPVNDNNNVRSSISTPNITTPAFKPEPTTNDKVVLDKSQEDVPPKTSERETVSSNKPDSVHDNTPASEPDKTVNSTTNSDEPQEDIASNSNEADSIPGDISNATTQDSIPASIQEIDTTNNDRPEEDENPIRPNTNRPNKWAVGFVFGPDVLQKQFDASSNLKNFEQKKNEEDYTNTWGFDFEFSRRLNKWFSISSGTSFKQYKENQEYHSFIYNTYNTYDTIIDLIDNSYFIYDSMYNQIDSMWVIIDSTWVVDTMTVTTINTTTHTDSTEQVTKGQTTSQYVQIPISTQLTLFQTKKLRGYTNLGLTFGILTKNTGQVIGYDDDNFVNYTTRKLIVSSTIGLGLNYNFYGPFDYKIYGAWQTNLSSFSLHQAVTKKYNGFNFRTGLVFNF